MNSCKIISWNVNGIRAIIKKDFINDIFSKKEKEISHIYNNKKIFIGQTSTIEINSNNLNTNNSYIFDNQLYLEIKNTILNEISKKMVIKQNINLINSLTQNM
mgnify:CR=1 FL=1